MQFPFSFLGGLPFLLIWVIGVIQQSGFYTWKFTMAILLVVPFPLLPHMTHSHFSSPHPTGPSPQYFPISSSIFSFSTVMRKWWWYHQHCISGIITHKFKPTEALDTALLHLSLANPVLKPEVCKNQDHEGSSQLKPLVKCLFPQ